MSKLKLFHLSYCIWMSPNFSSKTWSCFPSISTRICFPMPQTLPLNTPYSPCPKYVVKRSDQVRSVSQSCPTLCDPMNRSMPGLPVHHQLLEFTQTQDHQVSDAIQPFHPLSSPSPLAPNPSQHQSLFQWVNSSHEVAKVLEFSALASFLPKKSQG